MASKSGSEAKPTIEEVEEWDGKELLQWIQQNRPKALKGDNLEIFRGADIDGATFLRYAGDRKFFEECRLPIGTSERLANLASELAGAETAGDSNTRKRKIPPHTDIALSPKRTRVGQSSLIFNGELKHFRSGSEAFSNLIQQEGQAYFDRTRYISILHQLDKCILFCRPRRFGKSLTLSMLEHFHGLQYAAEHKSIYKDLDVQKDIDDGKVKPGQYFVLTFDFSNVAPSTDPKEAKKILIQFLISSVEAFYDRYTADLGGNYTDLCQNIDSENPNVSLERCVRLVRRVINQDERLSGIKGVYVLVDEYDALPTSYLESLNTGGSETDWLNTEVRPTFKSFWAVLKSLATQGYIQRFFITGISPLSLSYIGSAFNMTRNMSFDRDLAGLCGLTKLDLEDTLEKICEDSREREGFLSEMQAFFNGYHFCNSEMVQTVFNTETCLAYLQSRKERKKPDTQDPQNSEISMQLLQLLVNSAVVITDFEKALKYDENKSYASFEYSQFKSGFTLQELIAGDYSAWRSLLVYSGGLTFVKEKPETHLKIPNRVAADRIALAVLESYNLQNSLEVALQSLVDNGELERTLGVYRDLMTQRDNEPNALADRSEESHRDSFHICLLRNHLILPHTEFKVIKADKKNGRIDLVCRVSKWLIVTEWKAYRLPFLDVPGTSILAKAATLYDYTLPDILKLEFMKFDQYHQGTIRSWVMGVESKQLRNYILSEEVKQLLDSGLELQAHLVIVVGSRHILLWDMDKGGDLALEPRLVEMPKRVDIGDGHVKS